MFYENQTTVSREIVVGGIGLHGGKRSTVVLKPAPADAGIVIEHHGFRSKIRPEMAERNQLCTRLRTPRGQIDTVEHLMAAIAITRVDNVIICVDGDEIPILDGSALVWADAITSVGFSQYRNLRNKLRITSHFTFEIGNSFYQASPLGDSVSVTIDFPNPVIGKQSSNVPWDAAWSLLDARTFVLEKEIAIIREMGLAKGGSLENAIVVGENGLLNPGGLRSPDEFVRHKALDLIGDLFLIGKRISGEIRAVRPGHSGNNAFLLAMINAGVLEHPDRMIVSSLAIKKRTSASQFHNLNRRNIQGLAAARAAH